MRVTVPDEVVFRDLAGEAVLLHLSTGTYFGLDAVGTRIWCLLTEHLSTDTIIPILMGEFDVGECRLRIDLDGLVTQLLEEKLLIAIADPA